FSTTTPATSESSTLSLHDALPIFTTIRGQARIAKIVLRDRVFLSTLQSPIRYSPSELQLSGITAQIARGQLAGDFSMQPQAEDSPFTVHASFHRVQADQLVAEAGG